MLSNKVKRVDLTSITIDRESRQRREIDVSDILESVKRRGVLVPICITESGRLIFGERRLTAAKAAGHKDILARIAPDNLSPMDLQVLELEENIMRQDLPWQDKARAVATLFKIWCQTHEPIVAHFATSLGYTPAWVERFISTAREIEKGNERVAKAPGIQKAVNVIQRQRERENNNVVSDILDTINDDASQPPPIMADTVIHADFNAWAETYTGPKFNLIHCDFPYGIGLHDSDQLQVEGTAHRTYDDSPDIYWKLLETLATHRERFMSHSAHLIFWYSMKFHVETLDFLTKRLPEFTFDEYPLVWLKSDNRGIAPDVERRPRRIYETALFGWRGERKLIKLASNAYAAPKEASSHPSTKPEPVLRHFLSMVTDVHTRVLDPTCGSGSALRAAESLGAQYLLGLELDEEFVADANAKLRRGRLLSQVSEVVT